MALTQKQVLDLNRMNSAAQRANLGGLINSIDNEIFVASKTLVAGDISATVVTIPLVTGAVILSYSVTAADGTVRAVTKAVVTGTNALLTVTSVIATDIVHIIYGIWM